MKTLETNKPILLFDGICNLCHSNVIFVIKRDPTAHFRFASLQSPAGQRLLKAFKLPTDQFDSFILVESKTYYAKSTAILRVLKNLKGFWPLLYIFILVPRPLRDFAYSLIAKNRYRWFGQKAQCLLPTGDLKNRFLS